MNIIKQYNCDFKDISSNNQSNETIDKPTPKDKATLYAEKIFFWVDKVDNREFKLLNEEQQLIKKHCLREKIKIKKKVNKFNKEIKNYIFNLVDKKVLYNNTMKNINLITDQYPNIQDIVKEANEHYNKIKENEYQDSVNKSIPSPIEYISNYSTIKKQWDEYTKTENYETIIKTTNYGIYMNYMYNNFDEKLCEMYSNTFLKK